MDIRAPGDIRAHGSLDPRAPLVLDTRELARQPGAERRVRRSVPAPAGLGTDVLGVPESTEIELELRLESVMEGIFISGTARTRAAGECVRCLDRVERDLEVDVQELYVYPESDAGEDEAQRLEDGLADLEPVVRDAVVLALPFQPVCRGDCPGLCVRCGARLADEPDHRHEGEVDPRWAALAPLRQTAGEARDGAERDGTKLDGAGLAEAGKDQEHRGSGGQRNAGESGPTKE